MFVVSVSLYVSSFVGAAWFKQLHVPLLRSLFKVPSRVATNISSLRDCAGSVSDRISSLGPNHPLAAPSALFCSITVTTRSRPQPVPAKLAGDAQSGCPASPAAPVAAQPTRGSASRR